MFGATKGNIPFQSKITYRMIRYIRLSRNLTQSEFGEVCRINQGVLSQIEAGQLELSVNYESRILEGCKALKISEHELEAIKELLKLKGEQ